MQSPIGSAVQENRATDRPAPQQQAHHADYPALNFAAAALSFARSLPTSSISFWD